MASQPPIPIICGPTGSGKTAVGVEWAENHPIEIVSADSRQIIKHLNIGTAKPTEAEQRRVRFHLIDLIEPGERYSAFRFVDDANRAIKDILARNRRPLIVGGTGLYLRALSEGVVEIVDEDMTVRRELEAEMERQGPKAMYERLERIDPLEAASLHPNNKVRVIRALEIYHLTGKSKSELVVTGAYNKCDFAFSYHCLAPPREQLYRRINLRVGGMMADGLLQEVQLLIERGMKERLRRANVIGYSELLDYVDGKLTLDDAVALIKQNSRRYAKRQMTWFRHQTQAGTYPDGAALLEALSRG